MKLLIRILWFFPTFAIYVPVRNALETANLNGFFIAAFHLVYFFFVYVIPSNAFISLWKTSTTNRVNVLVKYIWSLVDDYTSATKSSDRLGTQLYIWTALYYSISDIIKRVQLDTRVKEQFIKITCRNFRISQSDQKVIDSMRISQLAFLSLLEKNVPVPLPEESVTTVLLFAYATAKADVAYPDGIMQNKFIEVSSALRSNALALFP